MVQAEVKNRTDDIRPHEFLRMTGGSTSKPVQIPGWREELSRGALDMWLARSWFGVTPAARCFWLWGHAHLLGSGWRGWLNARERAIKDRLLGYHRFSAYDLRDEAMRKAARELCSFRPEYVIGYSVALHLMASATAEFTAQFSSLPLKLVIAAAEAFPSEDCRQLVQERFGCAVAMEYGSVETGLIGHEQPGGGYLAFWRSYMLEAEPVGDSRWRLRVTSLTPRAFPLIRYEIGDEIELFQDDQCTVGLTRFKRVIGRSNDYLELPDGARIHSEAFSHAMRPCRSVNAFQVLHAPDGIRIVCVARNGLSPTEQAAIRERLGKIHRALYAVEIERVPALTGTIAGKTRMIVAAPTIHRAGIHQGLT